MSNAYKEVFEIGKELLDTATYVSDKVHLKTAVEKGETIIISTDPELYSKMLEKFPKEKMTKKSRKVGKKAAILGGVIAVIFSGTIGLSIAAIGLALNLTGKALDDYKNYTILMDYDNMRLIFVKTKGDGKIDLKKEELEALLLSHEIED